MKVLVTGGTGFVGREITRQLRDAGHQVRLLVRDARSPSSQRLATEVGAELSQGNILRPESFQNAFEGREAVIHLVGIISEVREQTFERVHTEATQNVVRAAKSAGMRRFIHMSALGTRANAVSRYHRSKWAAEEIVRGSGLDWTIFRPSIIYGPGDEFVNLFARMSRFSPVIPLIGGGVTKFQPIPVADVARCFVGALTEPRSIGRAFDVCSGETLSMREIVEAVLHATRRSRLKLPLPFGVANLQALVAEFLFNRVLGKAPPLNRDQLLMLREDNAGDGSAACEMFGLSQVRFGDGIAAYLSPRK